MTRRLTLRSHVSRQVSALAALDYVADGVFMFDLVLNFHVPRREPNLQPCRVDAPLAAHSGLDDCLRVASLTDWLHARRVSRHEPSAHREEVRVMA
jgi:hypothetical protein